MHFTNLALLTTLTTLIAAQDISPSDIPRECNTVCAEVLSIAQRCDRDNQNDAAELSCICNTPNANTLVPTCEACVRQFRRDDDDDDDNDVREVLSRCNFTTTAYNSASVPAPTGPSSLQSTPPSSVPSSGTVVVMTSGTVVMTTTVPPVVPSTTLVQQTGGAVPVKGAGAALGVGVMGAVLGML